MGALCLAHGVQLSLGVHEQGNDQTVKTQHFGENENQDHADEETRLLGRAADACIADDADGESEVGTSVVSLVGGGYSQGGN